jgi:hypothetical protein
MQADSWGYSVHRGRSTRKYWDGIYANTVCRACCKVWYYTSNDAKGATITGVILTVEATTSVDTYRFKCAVSASDTPSDTWSVIHDAPHFEGTTNGATFFIPFAATLDDYFFLYESLADYSALPLTDPGSGDTITSRYYPLMLSGGNLRFVLTS